VTGGKRRALSLHPPRHGGFALEYDPQGHGSRVCPLEAVERGTTDKEIRT